MPKVNIDLTNLPKLINDTFYPLLKDTNRYVVLRGGSGSGKSRFITQLIILRMLTRKDYRCLVIRKFGVTLRTSCFEEFIKSINKWGLDKLFKMNQSNMEISTINGNKIIFKGIDNPEKIKSISEINDIWIEECTEVTPEDFEQLDLRLRGISKYKYQMFLTFNPVSDRSWVKKVFYDRVFNNATLHLSTYKDNKFLGKEYHVKMEHLAQTNPDYYKIYALAEWGTLGDQIFTNYKVADLSKEVFDNTEITYGLDFGYYPDPLAMVKVAYKNNNIYILEEFEANNLTTTQFIDYLKNKKENNQLLNVPIYADCAEPKTIQDIRNNGFYINACTKGAGSIMYGIDFIKSKQVIINGNCNGFIKEIQNYCWKKDKNGNSLGIPSGMDHLLDSLRYSLEPRMSRKNVNVRWV